jgi:3-oxoacyl-[acyl-carrier protein] reductase
VISCQGKGGIMKKVGLITGGGRGIGFSIAQYLAVGGFDIVITGIRDKSLVQDSQNRLIEAGAQVRYYQSNVANRVDRANLLANIRQEFGRLDVLVNNAGVAPLVRSDMLHSSEDSFERLIKTNLQGPYFLTQQVANWMIEQKKSDSSFRGCIINISSISAEVASPSRGEYCVSKAGVSMATQLWATCLGEYDIPVYEIRPGIIKTDMTKTVEEKYNKLIEEGLLIQKRWGLAEDVGKAAAMLVKGDLSYSTGQVIYVDGGYNIKRL